MPVAKNIRYCRRKANLTQQGLADALGISKATVSSWERKKTAVPVPSAKRVAEFFGVGFLEFCDIDLESLEKETMRPLELSDTEVQNILMFRQLPDDIKMMIRFAITSAYSRNCETNESGKTSFG